VPETSKIDWKVTLTGEMLLLQLLGRIFYRYPDEEERIWFQTLIKEKVFSDVPFSSDEDETRLGLKLLQEWQKKSMTDESFEKIQADYTRLFIGPGKVLAAPWESVFFNEERLTFQEETLDVRHWYRRFGLEAEKIHHEPDDHIGLELIFMSHLATLAIQALEQHDQSRLEEIMEARRQFFTKHLGAWALSWCDLVEKNARTDFYEGLAHLTRGVINVLSSVLKIQIMEDAGK
jgi:TorA maturation chaperone TorD